MGVANNIKRYRKNKNLLQKELADKIGVTNQVISNWERGYTSPNYEDIVNLSNALECSTDELLGKERKDYFEEAEAIMFKDIDGFNELSPEKQQEIKDMINRQLKFFIEEEKRDS